MVELADPSGFIARFRAMRLTRNRSEHQDRPVGRQEVDNDLRHAGATIVMAVRESLST